MRTVVSRVFGNHLHYQLVVRKRAGVSVVSFIIPVEDLLHRSHLNWFGNFWLRKILRKCKFNTSSKILKQKLFKSNGVLIGYQYSQEFADMLDSDVETYLLRDKQ